MERRDDTAMEPTGAPGAAPESEPNGPGEGAPEDAAPAESGGAVAEAAGAVTGEAEVDAESVEAELRAEVTALGTALDEAREELARTADRHLRLAAEFDNYRKRTERERLEAYARAQAEVVSRLLDVMDDLERVAHFDESASAAALLEGVQLVDKKLRQVLESMGLEIVQAEGEIFNPATMEGLATVEADGPEEDDRVSDVFQKGYVYKGQLLRPARVRVKQYEG